MRNIYLFIIRYYFFFLALILALLAFLLTLHHQHYQRSWYIHSATLVSGKLYARKHAIESYFGLKSVNQALHRENAMLMQQLGTRSREVAMEHLHDNHADSLRITDYRDTLSGQGFRFDYITAEVINASVGRRNNYLTLDRGSLHGVERDMGVITPFGVVGIVQNVSEHFSSIMSLLHKDSQISVRHRASGHIGSLRWEGGNYRIASMFYIPSHVEINAGDSIFTSGFSRMFPGEIFIGTVNDVEMRRGDNFFTAEVQLSLDFNKLRHVYIVRDFFADELQELEFGNNINP